MWMQGFFLFVCCLVGWLNGWMVTMTGGSDGAPHRRMEQTQAPVHHARASPEPERASSRPEDPQLVDYNPA